MNPWLHSPSHSGLVSPGPHSLFLRVAGPTRISASSPVIIIEAGLGSTSSEWVSVAYYISAFARVYSYDRGGYGQSKPLSPSSLPATSKRRCQELTLLLEKAGVEPPWIIVGHSYGGALVREFLLMHGKDKVVGMVIVDSPATMPELPKSWPTLLGEATYEEVVGLERNRVLSDEQWAAMKADTEGCEDTVNEEQKYMAESYRAINEKITEGGQLLGNGRLSVVFSGNSVDFEKILKRAEKEGLGSEHAREEMRVRLNDFRETEERGQRDHLRLSIEARLVRPEEVARTHNIQFVDPKFVAEEVKWVFEGVK